MDEEKRPPREMPTRRSPRLDLTRSVKRTKRIPRLARSEIASEPDQKHRKSPRPEATEPQDSALFVPWWAFALVILVVAGITCGLWGVVLMSRGSTTNQVGVTPSAIFVVITATPTLGPPSGVGTSSDTTIAPTDVPIPGQGPTPTASPEAPIQVGHTVVIVNTDGEGLRLRQGPGVNYPLLLVGRDGEQFVVEEGPREADGYTWWYIVDPGDRNRFGWAAADYLQVISP